MKKIFPVFLFLVINSSLLFGQFLERFEALNETNLKEYAKPFATTFGLAMNSGGYYSADIPSLFGFSISFRGMYILIPDDQKTFTPVFSSGYTAREVPSIYGEKKGGIFPGPNGYQVTPPGLDVSALPMAYPQVTLSFMGTEVITPYVGLQYETSSLDIDYTYKPDPEHPELNQRLKVSLDGDNSFRAVVGTSLNLAFLVLNIDAGLSAQTVLSAGLTFAF